jgi:hypothetical protein
MGGNKIFLNFKTDKGEIMQTRHITCLFIILLVFCFSGCAQYAKKTFRGKLIDAETLKPIEGAVVVASWYKARPTPAGDSTYFKYAKETLTDKDGEWSITGPAGYQGKPGLYKLFLGITVGAIEEPYIIYYKPGYRNTRSFLAYPYIDKKRDLEGIVLIRKGETMEEYEAYNRKYDLVTDTPFISVKDPEEKLRNLEFSFKYPENVKTIWRKTEYVEADYVVRGLIKAKTREEMLRAMGGLRIFGPITSKIYNEERVRLGLKPWRIKKKR